MRKDFKRKEWQGKNGRKWFMGRGGSIDKEQMSLTTGLVQQTRVQQMIRNDNGLRNALLSLLET